VLARLFQAPPVERQALVDSLYAACPAFPVVEQDTVVHFLYRGQARRVAVAGDATGWQPTCLLTRLQGSDLWHARYVFAADARLDYKIVVDDNLWLLDPMNPLTIRGGFGPNSELRMGKYRPPAELVPQPDLPGGSVRDTVITSVHLGGRRRISVYIPPGFEGRGMPYPLAQFHDGHDYLTLGNAATLLDNLIASGKVAPLVAVFLSPEERQREYAGDRKEAWAAFILFEALPWVAARYPVSTDPRLRATIGASNGGNISLWLGFHHPEQFGNVGAQSSYVEPALAKAFQEGDKRPLRIYLDVGTYDLPLLIPLVRDLRQILDRRGYEVCYREPHEGHSWGNWRAHLDDLLTFLFPGPAVPGPRQ
jgi:enterochelin esterase family protein